MAAVNGDLVEFHGHKTRTAQPRGIEALHSSQNVTNQASRFIYCARQGGMPREVDSSGKELVEFHGHKTRNAPPRGIEMSCSSYNITAHDRVERPEKMIQAARKQLLLRAVLQHVCTRVLTPESSVGCGIYQLVISS
jgi:hypothetical protein